MQIQEQMTLKFGTNYGTKDEVYKMLSPDLFDSEKVKYKSHARGWQNQFRPVTIFRQKNHKVEFIPESNIGEGLNEIDYDAGTWYTSKLGVNKSYSNKNFMEFLFIVGEDGTCTYKGLWHHTPYDETKPWKLLYKDYTRTVFRNV